MTGAAPEVWEAPEVFGKEQALWAVAHAMEDLVEENTRMREELAGFRESLERREDL